MIEMRNILRGCVLLGVACTLASCDSIRDAAGLTKQPPDEFAVVTKAPLTLPPDYSLRPPQPRTRRPPRPSSRRSRSRPTLRHRGRLGQGREVGSPIVPDHRAQRLGLDHLDLVAPGIEVPAHL